jgi:hypothetical protein
MEGSHHIPRHIALIARPRRILAALGAVAALAAVTAPAASAAPTYWYPLTSLQSGKVMEVRAWSTLAGGRIDQWESNSNSWGRTGYGANQYWSIPFSGQTRAVVNKHSRLCLTTDGVAGSQLYQMPCNGSGFQMWTHRTKWIWDDIEPPFGQSVTYFQNLTTGLVIDVNHGSHENGAKIIGWPLGDGDNQRWTIGAATS